jgi:hypothetical protein
MVAWRESRQDEWRFERLRALFERLLDAKRRRKRRDAASIR